MCEQLIAQSLQQAFLEQFAICNSDLLPSFRDFSFLVFFFFSFSIRVHLYGMHSHLF